MVILILPIGVWAVDELPVSTEVNSVETIQSNEKEFVEKTQADEVVEPTTTNFQYKQPISKRKIAFKFLAAMGGVALSSFVLYILLTVYNRIREGVVVPPKKQDDAGSLETPDDYESAVKSFLDKTDWKK